MYKLGMYLFAVFDNFEFSLWRDVEVASRVALTDDESTGRNLEQRLSMCVLRLIRSSEDLVMSGRLGEKVTAEKIHWKLLLHLWLDFIRGNIQV